MTEPAELSTLPKRVVAKRVGTSASTSPRLMARSKLWTIISQKRLVAPMTLLGLTALSVESMTICSTPYSRHLLAMLKVPMMLVVTASQGFSSISGTCL